MEPKIYEIQKYILNIYIQIYIETLNGEFS